MRTKNRIFPIRSYGLDAITPYRDKISIATEDGIHIIPKDDIRYVKAQGNYCELLYSEERLLCSKPLKSISEKLRHNHFVRVHQSYLININFVSKIESDYSALFTDNKIWIPVSRSNRPALKELLQKQFD